MVVIDRFHCTAITVLIMLKACSIQSQYSDFDTVFMTKMVLWWQPQVLKCSLGVYPTIGHVGSSNDPLMHIKDRLNYQHALWRPAASDWCSPSCRHVGSSYDPLMHIKGSFELSTWPGRGGGHCHRENTVFYNVKTVVKLHPPHPPS